MTERTYREGCKYVGVDGMRLVMFGGGNEAFGRR